MRAFSQSSGNIQRTKPVHGSTCQRQTSRPRLAVWPVMFAVSILHLGQASAQTVTWDRGAGNNNINNAANWTTDTLPTGGILGIINNSIINPATVTGNALSGYTIQQDAGTVTQANRRWTQGTSWTLNGGTFTDSGRLLLGDLNTSPNPASVNTITINGGSFTATDILGDAKNAVGSFVTVTGGTLTLSGAAGVWSQGGALDLNVSGGTVNIDGFQFNSTSDKFTITGGSTEVGTGTVVLSNGGHVEFGLGAGSLLLNEVPAFTNAGYFNFLEDSEGSLTIAGFTKTDYETWWTGTGNNNRLRYSGTNTGNFDDVFKVTGATIVLVPEPTTLALAAAGAALSGLIVWRRRRG
jgi:hypothetical protein